MSLTRVQLSPTSLDRSHRLSRQDEMRTASSDDFRKLLLTLVMGFSQGSVGKGDSIFGNLLAPVMVELLDRLLAEEAACPIPMGMPIDGYLTQSFSGHHKGLDFGAPEGTPVRATMEGRVIHAGWNDDGYGNLVIIENQSYRTYFAHLSEIAIRIGQRVHAGEIIALSGNTGNSTGPHLHYEIRRNGRPIDPTPLTQIDVSITGT